MAKIKMKKLHKILLSTLLIVAITFPKSGLIHRYKTVEELEEDGEIHIGIWLFNQFPIFIIN